MVTLITLTAYIEAVGVTVAAKADFSLGCETANHKLLAGQNRADGCTFWLAVSAGFIPRR
jgi:hypothetical protein